MRAFTSGASADELSQTHPRSRDATGRILIAACCASGHRSAQVSAASRSGISISFAFQQVTKSIDKLDGAVERQHPRSTTIGWWVRVRQRALGSPGNASSNA